MTFSIPLQPFVEDCSPVGQVTRCTLESAAPYSFRVVDTRAPKLPSQLPVARYRPLTQDYATEETARRFGLGWTPQPTVDTTAPNYDTAVEFDLVHAEESVAFRGQTMTLAYSTTPPGCRGTGAGAAVQVARSWLKKHGFDPSGLTPRASPADRTGGRSCDESVTWSASPYGPGSLHLATVAVSGPAVVTATFSLPPIATRTFSHRPLGTAFGMAASLGSGPPVDAKAELDYVTELGNDGAWYEVPAATLEASSLGGAATRTIFAFAPIATGS
jgi:hypothetical protein